MSGGGVLNAEGRLVGIPVGRMQGDFRSRSFSRFARRCSRGEVRCVTTDARRDLERRATRVLH